jgi:hypothetical protein
MRKLFLSIFSLLIWGAAFSQGPNITSWQLNTTGATASYYNSSNVFVSMSDSSGVTRLCYNSTSFYVRTLDLAADYTMGPPLNPFNPAATTHTFKIPYVPVAETGTLTAVPSGGAIGLALNGVVLYGSRDADSYNTSTNSNNATGDGNWHGDAWYNEGTTMDVSGGGHSTAAGTYHYHANPIVLYDDPATTHSPIVGYALDGFPIYGPFGYSSPLDPTSAVTRMVSSYQLRTITTRTILPDGSVSSPAGPNVSATFPLGMYVEDYEYVDGLGHLDTLNGRYCVTPEYPLGTYAYFLSTDAAGSPAFPYIIGDYYYGECDAADMGPNVGNATIPSTGMTCVTTAPTCSVSIASETDITCNGLNNGSATAAISNFTSPSYVWKNSSNVTVGTAATLSNLAAGVYTLTVTDSDCSTSVSVTITEPTAINIASTVTNPACGATNGAIALTVSGGSPGTSTKGLIISEIYADPAGTDSPFEYVELLATKDINFVTNPYTIIVANNGSATTNGWIAGGSVTYAFQISTGSVTAGTVIYVGGSSMIPTSNVKRSINTGTTAGDGGIGSSNSAGVFGNGGTVDAVAVFDVGVSSITSSTVPIDALFYGTTIGTAQVSAGTAGYQLPVNDLYSGGKLQTTSSFAPGSVATQYLSTSTGVYNVQSNTFTTSRTWANTATVSTGTTSLTYTTPYSYSWSNGSTIEDLTALGAGSYTVTVTDATGCTASSTISLTSATGPTLSSTVTNVLCNGATTGAVNLTVSGGTPGYTYLWSNGATTQDLSNLAAGTYSVTVTDATSCTSTTSVTVTQPTSALSLSSTTTSVGCNGASTGAVNLTPTGGTSGYTYLWSNSATTQDLSNVAAGTYSVTVTDANSCTATTSATVTQPSSALSLSVTTTSVGCNGASTGAVNLTPTGGTTGYTYLWSNSATTQDLSNVAAGTYSVTVTDANSCTATTSATVTQPSSALSLSVTTTSVACNGASTGAVNLTPTGGTTGYTYLWSNFATTQDLSNVAAGTYSVTVTDANSCTATTSATVTQPSSALSLSVTTTSVGCNGASTGAVNLTPTGGTTGYSYVWSNSATSQDLSNVAAGTYSVTVTDANSCTATTSATVSQPSAISLTTAGTNVLCNGATTGAVNLTPTGGTGAYTYLWSNSATSQDLSSVAAGTYSVTVTDANSCTATTSATLTQPTAITLSSTTTSVTCGGTNGAINLTVSGGTSGYTYLWSNSATTQDLTGLSAGTYSVTVTDANNCTATTSVNVSSSSSLSVTTTVTNVLCNGALTGAVNATVSGGTSPYTYSWSNSSTSEDLTNVAAGTYTLTVTDATSCTAIVSATVTQPSAISLSATATNILCNGNTNGAIDLTVSGGTAGYTYVWSNSSTSQDLTNLGTGTYSVTVTDANACTASTSATITQPSALTASATSVNVLCNGGTTGSVNLTASGGTGALTYAWSNSSTSEDLSNVAAGTYSVTVTDANNCTATASATVSQPTAISASASSVNALCNGGTTGSVNLTASGGTGALTYAWSNSSTSEDLSSIGAGTYSVTITDANNCTATAFATVSQPTAISITSSVTSVSCGGTNGAIDLSVTGGTGAYTYLWSNSATSQDLSSLAAGTYSVTVTDANNCTATSSVNISSSSTMSLSTTVTNIGCNGNTTGAVNLTVTGGTAGYTFSWSNSATSEDLSNLAAGTYTVTVTDASSCTSITTVTITEPAAITLTTSATNVSCNAGTNGAIDLTATGGTGALSFAWSNSSTSEDLSNLAAGSYSVTVTDANNCTATTSVTITQPAATFSIGSSTSGPTCNGGSNGSINLTVTGASSYSYVWSNSATTEDLTGLSAGSYSVTVTDMVSGCTLTQSFTVNQPTALSLSSTTTNETFGNDGAIDLTVTGGISPYTYAWSNSATTQDLTGIAGGTYSVVVTDNNGCTATSNITVISTIGIEDVNATADIKVFPNPSADYIMIDAGGKTISKLVITNEAGQVVMTPSVATQIDISSLANGTYFITAELEDGIVTKRVIKMQ